MLKERFGDWKTYFRYIPRVLEWFKEIDPDSTLDLVTRDHAFFRAFDAPSASRTALRFCRPVIADPWRPRGQPACKGARGRGWVKEPVGCRKKSENGKDGSAAAKEEWSQGRAACTIPAGTFSAGTDSAAKISAAKISAATISAATIYTRTISAAPISAESISAATISTSTIKSPKMSSSINSACFISAATTASATIPAAIISAAAISAATISAVP
ncbi:unnamed protein product [Closterium sp. Naga37s-1]|nr:unnamed protein product [Closterium sp. Naga37s-1]